MNEVMKNVCSVCNTVRDDSIQGICFQKLLSKLRKEFRKQVFDLHIKTTRNKDLLPGEYYINATYDSFDDHLNETPIEVVVYHNFDKLVEWETKHVTEFLIQIFDAVVHEFKHQRQSFTRIHESYWTHTSSTQNFKGYLEDPDEIDAYALSIAIELCRTLGKFRALRYMTRISLLGKFKIRGLYASPTLSSYLGTVGDLNNPIIKKLAKKIYIRLQKIDTEVIFM